MKLRKTELYNNFKIKTTTHENAWQILWRPLLSTKLMKTAHDTQNRNLTPLALDERYRTY